MTNKEIKELVTKLESTLVSLQNKNNTDSFNVRMLRGQVELKTEIINNRNNQVKEMQNTINEKNGSIGNLEFLLDKKNEEIEALKIKITDFEQAFKMTRDILDNPSLTDNETVTEITKIF